MSSLLRLLLCSYLLPSHSPPLFLVLRLSAFDILAPNLFVDFCAGHVQRLTDIPSRFLQVRVLAPNKCGDRMGRLLPRQQRQPLRERDREDPRRRRRHRDGRHLVRPAATKAYSSPYRSPSLLHSRSPSFHAPTSSNKHHFIKSSPTPTPRDAPPRTLEPFGRVCTHKRTHARGHDTIFVARGVDAIPR